MKTTILGHITGPPHLSVFTVAKADSTVKDYNDTALVFFLGHGAASEKGSS